jgi:hypothetical protein
VQAVIIAKLKEPSGSYEAVCKWLRSEWSIKTSVGALSAFWSWWHLKQRMDLAEQRSRNFEEQLRTRKDYGLSEDEIITLGNKIFIEQGVETGDAKLFTAVVDRILSKRTVEGNAKLKTRQLDIAERRVKLLENKAAQADKAAKVNSDASLTPEQYRARMREIFDPK